MQPKDIMAQVIANIRAQCFDEAKALLVAEGFEYVGRLKPSIMRQWLEIKRSYKRR